MPLRSLCEGFKFRRGILHGKSSMCSGNTTVSIVAFAVVGCLVGLNPHLSRLQEVVICWLSLNLVLVLLVLLILPGVVC